jgi:methionine synthase I (cobalamin-dependent)
MTVMGDITAENLYEAFTVQVRALEAGGADALIIETMSAADEAVEGIRAARDNTGCTIIGSFTFEANSRGEFRTMMGLSPENAARAAVDAGAHILGANCGRGYQGMERVVEAFKNLYPDIPVLLQTNAGIPAVLKGEVVFPATPEEMAGQVALWIEAGARIIGGCCGTTPEHIRAIRAAVDRHIS